MLSLTLDTSCALNFLSLRPEEPDGDLLRLLHLAFRHRVLAGVTVEAHEEVKRSDDPVEAERASQRLAVLGDLDVAPGDESSVSALAAEMMSSIFPRSQAGSTRADHNLRDCRQLAAHKAIGRDLFVTRDKPLLRRR